MEYVIINYAMDILMLYNSKQIRWLEKEYVVDKSTSSKCIVDYSNSLTYS